MNPFRDPSTYFHALPGDVIRLVRQFGDAEQQRERRRAFGNYIIQINNYRQKEIKWNRGVQVPLVLTALLPGLLVVLFLIIFRLELPLDERIAGATVMFLFILISALPLIRIFYHFAIHYYEWQCQRLKQKLDKWHLLGATNLACPEKWKNDNPKLKT